MNVKYLKSITALSLFLFCAAEINAREKSYENADAYVENFNALEATIEQNPTEPGKVLELSFMQNFETSEQRYFVSLLMADRSGKKLHAAREGDNLTFFDLTRKTRVLSIDVSNFEEKGTVAFNGTTIDSAQFMGDENLSDRISLLRRTIDRLGRDSARQVSWTAKMLSIASQIISLPFDVGTAWANPAYTQDSVVGRAVAAAGKGAKVKVAERPLNSFSGCNGRAGTSANPSGGYTNNGCDVTITDANGKSKSKYYSASEMHSPKK